MTPVGWADVLDRCGPFLPHIFAPPWMTPLLGTYGTPIFGAARIAAWAHADAMCALADAICAPADVIYSPAAAIWAPRTVRRGAEGPKRYGRTAH